MSTVARGVPSAAARRPGLVFQPTLARAFRSGVRQVVAAVRPTLGPTPRLVAAAKPFGGAPDLLDDGAGVARRIVALSDRTADVGAMYARAVIWRTHEDAGDGTATTAVIFQAAFEAGAHWVAAGGDPRLLRVHLGRASDLVLDTLTAMSERICGKERLAQAALAACADRELACLLGEIFDVVGAEGQVDVRGALGRGCDREYVDGMHWAGGVQSALFVADLPDRRAVLEDAALFISDLDLTDPEDVLTIVARAREASLPALVVVAQRLSDRALGALVASQDPPRFRAIAVKTPGTGERARLVAMEDLALLTGGRVVARAAGDRLDDARADGFGRARLAWADRDHFGVIGGQGDPRQLRRRVARLRSALRDERDGEVQTALRERLAKLLGGSATLWVGAASPSEAAARKANATRTVAVLRGIVTDGVVPGGGGAFLDCRETLAAAAAASTDADERAALRLVARALEEPTRTIVANAGADPARVLARIAEAGPGAGYDARLGRVVSMADAGVLDSTAVAKTAVRSALAGAGHALTIDTLVQRRSPEIATEPG